MYFLKPEILTYSIGSIFFLATMLSAKHVIKESWVPNFHLFWGKELP